MKIEYDGDYPNLCSGQLVVVVDGTRWKFPAYCLMSGGSVSFDPDWEEIVTEGPWVIDKWPTDFPAELQGDVLHAVNSEIRQGCCGGCV
jgi:hypothetical protein